MTIYQPQFLSEIAAGHDGPRIPAAKLAYFQERFRLRIFEFILSRFLAAQQLGLTQAKLARRIGKTADVVNRWLSGPGNLTSDTISDLLIGIAAEELNLQSLSVLHRSPVNFSHLDSAADAAAPTQDEGLASALKASAEVPFSRLKEGAAAQ